MQATHEPAWYILYTKRRLEKKVMYHLSRKKITHYCPFNKIKEKFLNRISTIYRPLFPSYIFVYATPDLFKSINRISSVLSMVHRLSDLATVSSDEINGIKRFLESHENVIMKKMPVSFSDLTALGMSEVIQKEGLNYFATLDLHSLGFSLKASVSSESVESVETVKSAEVVFLKEEYPAFTVNLAN